MLHPEKLFRAERRLAESDRDMFVAMHSAICKVASFADFEPRDTSEAAVSSLSARDFAYIYTRLPEGSTLKNPLLIDTWEEVLRKCLGKTGGLSKALGAVTVSEAVILGSAERPQLALLLEHPQLTREQAALEATAHKLTGEAVNLGKSHLTIGELNSDSTYHAKILATANEAKPASIALDEAQVRDLSKELVS